MLKLVLRRALGTVVYFVFISYYAAADNQSNSALLIYCDGDGIQNFDLASHLNHSTMVSGIAKPMAVDYNFKHELLFWTDNQNAILRAPLWQDRPRPTILAEYITSKGIAVDWIHDLIYWTDYGNSAIEVARLDGSMRKTLIRDNGIRPLDIVLNPAEGLMFFSCSRIPKIERCRMDGSKRETIVKEDILTPNGLAIDLENRRIFWMDYKRNRLGSANFDGTHRKDFPFSYLTDVSSSIDIYGQYLYFIAFPGVPVVYRATKVAGAHKDTITLSSPLNSLKVFDRSKQLEGFNACGANNGGCSHLCLRTSVLNFSCACPDGLDMSRDNVTCLNPDGSEVTASSLANTPLTSQVPITVSHTKFTSNGSTEENGETVVDTISGYSGLLVMLAFVMASLALFIAMVGLIITLCKKRSHTTGTPTVVYKKNGKENLYEDCSLVTHS